MNENPLRPPDDADFWSIPLHGISVPLPPTADVPPSLPTDAPTADTPATIEFFQSDDVPSDDGYHPRLRRSA